MVIKGSRRKGGMDSVFLLDQDYMQSTIPSTLYTGNWTLVNMDCDPDDKPCYLVMFFRL